MRKSPMRNFIDIINSVLVEDQDPTKVKDKIATPEINLDDGSSKGDLSAPVDSAAPAAYRPGRVERNPGIRAVPTDARSLNYLDALLRSDLQDEISDEEAAANSAFAPMDAEAPADTLGHDEPVPVTPENLPAVISQAMARTDWDGVPPNWEPKWMQIKDTPGYFQNQIRALGRMIFSPFTDIPIEDINLMADPFTTSRTNVELMARWIFQNGVRDDQAEMTFDGIMPGYGAQTSIWNALGYTFMCVQDHAGYYIYSWPGGRGVHLDAPPEMRRLTETETEIEEDYEAFDGGFDAAKRKEDRESNPHTDPDEKGTWNDGYDISAAFDDEPVKEEVQEDEQVDEGVRKFNDPENVLDAYVSFSNNGHITNTEGPMTDQEADALVQRHEGEADTFGGPFDDPFGLKGKPLAETDDLMGAAKLFDRVRLVRALGELQVGTKCTVVHVYEGGRGYELEGPDGIVVQGRVGDVEVDIDRQPLGETMDSDIAKQMAILAGIRPAGISKAPDLSTEAGKIANDFAILAGIRR